MKFIMLNIFKRKKPNTKNQFIKELDPPNPDNLLWTTKEGQKLLVIDMTDDHLRNAHCMLAKKLKLWATLEVEMERRKLKPKDVVFKMVPRPKKFWEYDVGDGGCFDNPDLMGISDEEFIGKLIRETGN